MEIREPLVSHQSDWCIKRNYFHKTARLFPHITRDLWHFWQKILRYFPGWFKIPPLAHWQITFLITFCQPTPECKNRKLYLFSMHRRLIWPGWCRFCSPFHRSSMKSAVFSELLSRSSSNCDLWMNDGNGSESKHWSGTPKLRFADYHW